MNKLTIPANEMSEHIKNEHGCPIDLTPELHKGFTIGNGSIMYWYFIWHTTGNFTAYSDDVNIWPRWCRGDQLITIHFK